MTRLFKAAGDADIESSGHFGDGISAPLSETLSRVATMELGEAQAAHLGIPGWPV